MEDLDEFRERARTWIRANLPIDERTWGMIFKDSGDTEAELAAITRERELQRLLFDGGLAGICVPVEYGGQGLTPAHQKVLDEEIEGREAPKRLQVPTFSPCMAVILEFGTEEQKRNHIPAILRGDELWMQLLSEPSGGSDVAGALTSAVRDGDEWVLNGSKVWTTGAWWSDWGLCLARTNWEVPKHRGLTVFMLPLHQPGIDVHRIEMINGSKEFCQEFISDVRVPDTDRVGEVDAGWTVGTRWMFHERMGHNSPFVTGSIRPGDNAGGPSTIAVDIARRTGRTDDTSVLERIGEIEMMETVSKALLDRVGEGIVTGTMSDQASAIGRMFHGTLSSRVNQLLFELVGAAGGAWIDDDADPIAGRGVDYLMRQTGSIGGGTTEMARNVVSERVLGMPRERTGDKDIPFKDVPRGPS